MNEKSKKLMAEYIDRGMIKWQPFAALEGHGEYVKAEAIKRFKISKPVLSSDQKDRLDIKLRHALESNKKVMIKYYKDGFLEFIIGVVSKLDRYKKEIRINDYILPIESIVDIK